MSSPSVPTSRQLLTVDLHGIKPALIERARCEGVSVSTLVRDALNKTLQDHRGPVRSEGPAVPSAHHDRVRLSLRLAREQADELNSRARVAGLPLGRYVITLMHNSSEPPSAADRAARVSALTRSNAELSTLSRNIARLTALLRQGSVRAAQEYRQTLDTLDGDVRAHLALVADVLADEPTRRQTT